MYLKTLLIYVPGKSGQGGTLKGWVGVELQNIFGKHFFGKYVLRSSKNVIEECQSQDVNSEKRARQREMILEEKIK
jgi:hypothetical protein